MQGTDPSARPPAKRAQTSHSLGSTFKKFGKYLAEQSQQSQSHSALHLCPPPPRQYLSSPYPRALHEHEHDSTLDPLTVLNRNVPHYTPQPHQKYTSPGYLPSPAPSVRSMASAGSGIDHGIFHNMTRQQYSPHNILQSYDIWTPEKRSTAEAGLWVVYIHGGYFRDPKVDSTSLKPAIEYLETGRVTSDSTPSNSRASSRNNSRRPSVSEVDNAATWSDIRHKIQGYASINYRLSPHPAYPQDPAQTASYTLNTAQYPDHLTDVLAALTHFQSHHPEVGANYMLAGHSVGATLALLALLKLHDRGLHCPKAVIGLSGIYDFEAIHRSNPDYKYITGNAMAPDQFGTASPAQKPLDTYQHEWRAPIKNLLIAHSHDDGLVPWAQVERVDQLFRSSTDIHTEVLELHGAHNDIWAKGEELARAIEKAVEMCMKL